MAIQVTVMSFLKNSWKSAGGESNCNSVIRRASKVRKGSEIIGGAINQLFFFFLMPHFLFIVAYALEKPLSENTSVAFVPRLDVPLTVIFIPARMALTILVSSSGPRFHAVSPSVNIKNLDFSIEILSALCFLKL